MYFKNRFKITGKLPLVSIQVTDKKLQEIMELVESIPKPEPVTDVPAPVKSFQVLLFSEFIKYRIKKETSQIISETITRTSDKIIYNHFNTLKEIDVNSVNI